MFQQFHCYDPCSSYCSPCRSQRKTFFFYFILFYLFILLHNIVLILPCIDLNPPWVHMCSPSRTPLPLPSPSHPIPLGHPSTPAPSTLYHALNLDWWFISHMNLHLSMPFSHIILPSSSPIESKRLFNTSVSLAVSRTRLSLGSF